MPFLVKNHRTPKEKLLSTHPGAEIIDVTSKGPEPWLRFSPFYPHGQIPIPFSPGEVSASVEGIWQGLKVFESQGVDPKKFTITNMKGLKRTVRSLGKPLGHREGILGEKLLSYAQARRAIYLPSYLWVLENRLTELCKRLKELSEQKMVLLLDFETNCDIEDLSKPLSHAGLIQRYLEKSWPSMAA